jgi:hypothetical protein
VLTQHVEGLWTRDLVNEVQAHEKLCLPARQHANRVIVPNLVKKGVHRNQQ